MMRKLLIFFFVGFILASTILVGISPATENTGKGNSKKVEIKQEGYQLTPADKHSQLLSILIILTIMALTI
ncbi:MAG: hypothetical protein GXO98_04095 [Nitrospirae bacterium]|nr:hypothetical protein [Nitrospirota bacterium]